MSDPLSLDFLGALIRSVQSDQRTIRAEIDNTRRELRARMDDLERSLGDRMAGIDARLETRFDQMQSEMVRSLDRIVDALRNGPPASFWKNGTRKPVRGKEPGK